MATSRPDPDEAWVRGALLALVAASTLIRLALAASLGLAPDEAYYWQWSRDLTLAYPDHPPLVAWAIRGGTALLGQTALAVRLPAVLAGALGTLLVSSLARALDLTPRLALIAALLTTISPLVATGALIMTPDSLIGLGWLAATWLLVRLTRAPRARDLWLLGAVCGLGLTAKHSALLLVPLVLIGWRAFADPDRARLRLHAWGALGLATVVALPHLLALAVDGGGAFRFQLDHLAGRLVAVPMTPLAVLGRFGEVLGGQLGTLGPFVVLGLVGGRRAVDRRHRLLLASWLIPIGATLGAAILTHPELGWASLGQPAAVVVAVAALARTARPRRWLTLATVWSLLVALVIHLHATCPFLPLPPDRDPVSRLHGATALDARRLADGPVTAVVCDHYGLAATQRWLHRADVDAPPFLALDRGAPPPPGTWLLVDQQGDFGEAGLSRARCGQRRGLPDVVERRADGAWLRSFKLSVGERCQVR